MLYIHIRKYMQNSRGIMVLFLPRFLHEIVCKIHKGIYSIGFAQILVVHTCTKKYAKSMGVYMYRSDGQSDWPLMQKE